MAHVTMGLMTCLLLIGASHASIIRSSAFELREEFRQMFKSGQKTDFNHTLAPLYDPPQCRRVACPPAKLVANRGSYTKVYFSEAVYAKVRVEGKTMVPALFEAYDRLRKYYDGANSEKLKMPMTAPVILRNDVGGPDGMFNPRNFTLFFYMDPRIKSPPTPFDKDINVLMVNSYNLYIRTFSSYTVTYADWMRELLQLADDVEADGEPHPTNFFYFATYDSPFQMTKRINEVQLLVPHDDVSGL